MLSEMTEILCFTHGVICKQKSKHYAGDGWVGFWSIQTFIRWGSLKKFSVLTFLRCRGLTKILVLTLITLYLAQQLLAQSIQ